MQSNSNRTSTPDGLVNHLPDEICVDVSAPRGSDPSQLYDQVRAALNQYLRDEAPGLTAARLQADGLGAQIAQDVAPVTLGALGGDALQSLVRSQVGGQRAGARRPWVELPSIGGDDDHWHFYYQVGAQRVSFSAAQQTERHAAERRVRQLTHVLNLGAQGLIIAPIGQAWTLSGSQPNWLTASLPFSCGSPAALPVAVKKDAGPWPFKFGRDLNAALAQNDGAQRARVIIAVLDTCPPRKSLKKPPNKQLKQLLRALHIHDGRDDGLGLPRDYFDPPPGVPVYANACLPWWQDDMPTSDLPPGKFAMPDHGLFVSSIVHTIAPDVELHLVRVLNDFGVGDLLALEHILRALPDALLPEGDETTRLVINLSLGSAVPVPGQRYFGSWLPDTCDAARGQPAEGRARELLRRAHGGLSSTMQWLYDRGVLVVAAAGNDALREHYGGIRPQPRYPAYYEQVLSVAAADADGEPALYSNRGDVDPFFNGITTFGGAVKKPKSRRGVPRPKVGGQAREKSIVGLYCSPILPGGKSNKTGWVHWAGTSFSTPIVSALAALLWQQNAAQTPHDIMRRLRTCAHNIPGANAQGPDPDGALDAPFLEVWQESPS